jgi:hypothetical protein
MSHSSHSTQKPGVSIHQHIADLLVETELQEAALIKTEKAIEDNLLRLGDEPVKLKQAQETEAKLRGQYEQLKKEVAKNAREINACHKRQRVLVNTLSASEYFYF